MFDPRGSTRELTSRSPSEPRHRPQGPERRPKGDDEPSSFIHSFRAVVTDAFEEAESAWRPRIVRYPY